MPDEQHSPLLISERLRYFMPSLAVVIGLNEAIVVQQLHYWLKDSTNERDGYTWVYNTYKEWQEQFPWWSEDQIQRIFLSLEKRGIVVAKALNASRYDHRKWYRIDHEKLLSMTQICTISGRKSESSEAAESRHLKGTQITTQITTQICADDTAPRENAPAVPEQIALLDSLPAGQVDSKTRRRKTAIQTEGPSEVMAMKEALAGLCQTDLTLASSVAHINFAKVSKSFLAAGVTLEHVERFRSWWYTYDFRGKQQQPPSLRQVQDEWGKAMARSAPKEYQLVT